MGKINFDSVSVVGLGTRKKLEFGRCVDWRGNLERQISSNFAIAKDKDTSVKKNYIDKAKGKQWNVEVMRNLNEWKVNDYESLLSSLCYVSLNENYDQLI